MSEQEYSPESIRREEHEPAPSTTNAPAPSVMDSDEAAQVRETMAQYSGYPAIQTAFNNIITANAGNPERMTALVRELVDQIEQVRSNPEARHPVNPDIAAAVEAIREVELQKPDPLNMLRGPRDQHQESPLTLGNVLGAAAVPTVMAFAEPEVVRPHGVTADRMLYEDLGLTTAALAFNPPQVQADLPGQQRDRQQGIFA